MSKTRRFPLLLLVAGASLAGAQPALATAGPEPKLVPFHGSLAGTSEIQVAPPRLFIAGTGAGHATHLGATDWTFNEVVTLGQVVTGCPTLGTTASYTGTLTAANGDTITVVGSGTGCPTSPTTATIVDVFTVTGGSGRFEGATGNFASVTFVDQPTKSFVLTFDGALSTVGGNE
jgi:hypothetical protein